MTPSSDELHDANVEAGKPLKTLEEIKEVWDSLPDPDQLEDYSKTAYGIQVSLEKAKEAADGLPEEE